MKELLLFACLALFLVAIAQILRGIYKKNSNSDKIPPQDWERHYSMFNKEINGDENE